ncbi:molybdopterin synthase catalytic subunit MoaE [Microbulbifer sp. OS29]|uniref:Molybdopterin synthase catalytic subunit n=1 Tax=Microbulbifer okhotskensis TaxID=2926617 RepID=A0A9X2ES37_9GAMM|nr:molybdopterin synthase catalytic subunit MoaE [Microbulbifer okhotskensis]MCO1334563.1 molybdopterin synthase catalytic subunit MoaE [Microbulbifer okhotskensis]
MKAVDRIEVCEEPLNVAAEYTALQGNSGDGACALFVGSVRDFNAGSDVCGLALEHYPGMTEKSLQRITRDARDRWSLGRVTIVHRVGPMQINDEIVFVGVTSPHRQAAFAACQYIMDRLKTEAPFWKREAVADQTGSAAERWVEARDSDAAELEKWSAG